MIKLIKFYFTILSKVSPKTATNQAFELFQKVRKKSIREREKAFYDSAKKKDIEFDPEPIHTYSFGNPENDTIILIHGWDSNAGSLSKFIQPLLAKNKHVLSFNLPAHAHYNSDKTNLLQCKNAAKKVLSTFSDTDKVSIISHSFGSAVTGYALSELDQKIDQLIFLTSPNKIDVIFLEFKNMIGLSDKAYRLLVKKANNIINEDLETLYIHDKLNQSTYNKLAVFHDENDKVISIENSKLLVENTKNSILKTYKDIGHYRMLWNDELIDDVLQLIG